MHSNKLMIGLKLNWLNLNSALFIRGMGNGFLNKLSSTAFCFVCEKYIYLFSVSVKVPWLNSFYIVDQWLFRTFAASLKAP